MYSSGSAKLMRVAVDRGDGAPLGLARVEVGRGEHDLVARASIGRIEHLDLARALLAVAASLVQLWSRLPCRLSVPRSSMMPRSPMVLMFSPLTLSVRVMVALWVKGLASLPICSSPPGT